MKTRLLLTVALALNLQPAALLWAAPLGTAFTYQGRLNDGSNPAQGIYDLRFAIYDAATSGAPVGNAITNSPTAVSNGLFTVTLDFGAGVFTGEARWLEIGVRSNTGSADFTFLSPRQVLTPTPYAVYAATSPIADGAVTGSKIADSAVTSAKIADGTVTNADLALDAVTSAKVLNGTLTGFDLADNTVGSAQLADGIALGSSSVNGQLDVYHTDAGTPAISLLGDFSQVSTYGSDGLEQTRLFGTGWGELRLNNSLTNNARAVLLTANANGGGYLQLNDTNGVARARLDGLNHGGALSLWAGDGSLGLSLNATNAGGNMLLHDSAGVATVQLRGDAGGRIDAANSFHVTTTLGGLDQVVLTRASSGGRLYTYDEFEQTTSALGSSTAAGGFLQLYQSNGWITVTLDGDETGANGGGSLHLANTNGLTRVSVLGQGADGSGEINVSDTSGTETIELLGQQSSTLGSRITLRQSSGVASMTLNGEYGGTGEGSAIILNNGAGSARLRLEGDNNDAGYVVVQGTNGAANVSLSGNAGGKGRVTTDQLFADELRISGSTASLNFGDTLVPTTGYVRVSGNGDYAVLNTTTAIANGSAVGTILILEGTSSSYSVTIPNVANTRLQTSRTLRQASTLMLIWNGSDWVELSFSDNN